MTKFKFWENYVLSTTSRCNLLLKSGAKFLEHPSYKCLTLNIPVCLLPLQTNFFPGLYNILVRGGLSQIFFWIIFCIHCFLEIHLFPALTSSFSFFLYHLFFSNSFYSHSQVLWNAYIQVLLIIKWELSRLSGQQLLLYGGVSSEVASE